MTEIDDIIEQSDVGSGPDDAIDFTAIDDACAHLGEQGLASCADAIRALERGYGESGREVAALTGKLAAATRAAAAAGHLRAMLDGETARANGAQAMTRALVYAAVSSGAPEAGNEAARVRLLACPKCGSGETKMAHCDSAERWRSREKDDHCGGEEHFHRRCPRCTYTWRTDDVLPEAFAPLEKP